MTGTLVLIRHSWRRVRPLILLVAALLGAFQVIMILAARTLQTTGTLSQLAAMLPPVVRFIVGPALVSVMSFAGIAMVGYFHFVVVGALAALAITAGTEPAGEVETGFADLLLARPVPRSSLVTRSVAVLAAASAVVVGAMWLGTAVGLRWLTPPDVARPSWRLVLELGGNLWALMTCWGAVAILAAAASRRRSVAAATAGLLALAAFLLDYVARFWKPAAGLAWLSPFHYFGGMELLMGSTAVSRHITVLLGIAVVCVLAAYVAIRRRDI